MELNQLSESLDWLDRNINGLPVRGGLRNHLAVASFDLVHEIARAVYRLLREDVAGRTQPRAAGALIRPAFEALIRGVWFRSGASEKDLSRFTEGRLNKEASAQLQSIRTSSPDLYGYLKRIKDRHWSNMSEYAHANGQSVMRGIDGSEIKSCVSEDQIQGLAAVAELLALLSGVVLFDISGCSDLRSDCVSRMVHRFTAGHQFP